MDEYANLRGFLSNICIFLWFRNIMPQIFVNDNIQLKLRNVVKLWHPMRKAILFKFYGENGSMKHIEEILRECTKLQLVLYRFPKFEWGKILKMQPFCTLPFDVRECFCCCSKMNTFEYNSHWIYGWAGKWRAPAWLLHTISSFSKAHEYLTFRWKSNRALLVLFFIAMIFIRIWVIWKDWNIFRKKTIWKVAYR